MTLLLTLNCIERVSSELRSILDLKYTVFERTCIPCSMFVIFIPALSKNVTKTHQKCQLKRFDLSIQYSVKILF